MNGGRMPASGKHVLVLPVVAAAVLVPWTIGIATHLPHSAVAHHWNTAWAGLDIAIMVGLVLTSWLGRRRDRRVALVATATATLTCVDAWFDVCTSASGSPLACAVAEAAVELLVAAACLVIGRRPTPELRPRTGRRRTTTEHRRPEGGRCEPDPRIVAD